MGSSSESTNKKYAYPAVYIQEGSPVTLHCKGREARLTFQYDISRAPLEIVATIAPTRSMQVAPKWEHDVEQFDTTGLRIHNLRLDRDNGVFVCSSAEGDTQTKVIVTDYPVVYTREGSYVELTCKGREAGLNFQYDASDEPREFVADIAPTRSMQVAPKWAHDVEQYEATRLRIHNLRLDRDNGVFVCSSPEGGTQTKVIVTVPVEKVIIEPVTYRKAIADTTTFTCTTGSNPPAKITWELAKPEIETILLEGETTHTMLQNRIIKATSTLKYTAEKHHNGANIQCIGQNRIDSDIFVVMQETELVILFPPDAVNPISGYKSFAPVLENSTEGLELTCSAQSQANPNTLIYDWSSDCGDEAGSTSQISVPRTRAMHGKQCTCTVTHSETGWSASSPPVTFNILYPPEFVNPIAGYASTDQITEVSGEFIQLTCSVEGGTNPEGLTYSWSIGCGVGLGDTSVISVPRTRSMNDLQCTCTVTHHETGWERSSEPITFDFVATSSVNIIAVVAGVTVPLIAIIAAILVIVICRRRRQRSARSKTNKPGGNNTTLSTSPANNPEGVAPTSDEACLQLLPDVITKPTSTEHGPDNETIPLAVIAPLATDAGEDFVPSSIPDQHIMISYQHEHQPILLRLCEALKDAGYKVWMDVDNMGQNILDSMAEAVENSFVVLMCVSEKYQTSINCKREAEYACICKKPIIPLMMQARYTADGWLGMIMGTKLYYRFTKPEHLETNMGPLLKGIKQSISSEKPVAVVKPK